ncbi:MAG: SAM-dependent methyltransferase [Candidatus Hodarchaeales archaeon]|jgi:cyclopropane fatty-acyl-phospholipid synthase-like methyltransferase
MSGNKINQETVLNYFDRTMPIYQLYSKNHLHYGIWNRNTANKEESLINLTKLVCKLLDIKQEDRILDAGCGVGGSANYIASTYGVTTVGINLSRLQLHKAQQLSHHMNTSSLIKYYQQDYTKTLFPPSSFTKIFGIESICHTPDKGKFITEAYRLLKDEGKLVVADGFRLRENLNESEKALLRRFFKGWAVPNLESFEGFRQKLIESRFSNIKCHDITKNIVRASWRMHRSAKQAYPIFYLLTKLKLINHALFDHCEGAYTQKLLVDGGILRYGIITANK